MFLIWLPFISKSFEAWIIPASNVVDSKYCNIATFKNCCFPGFNLLKFKPVFIFVTTLFIIPFSWSWSPGSSWSPESSLECWALIFATTLSGIAVVGCLLNASISDKVQPNWFSILCLLCDDISNLAATSAACELKAVAIAISSESADAAEVRNSEGDFLPPSAADCNLDTRLIKSFLTWGLKSDCLIFSSFKLVNGTFLPLFINFSSRSCVCVNPVAGLTVLKFSLNSSSSKLSPELIIPAIRCSIAALPCTPPIAVLNSLTAAIFCFTLLSTLLITPNNVLVAGCRIALSFRDCVSFLILTCWASSAAVIFNSRIFSLASNAFCSLSRLMSL